MPQQTIIKPNQNYLFPDPINVGVISAFSRRRHKNMSLFYGDTRDSLNNRRYFLEGLGIDYRDLVCAKQVHDTKVSYVGPEDQGKGALYYDTAIDSTDALITDKKNIPLAIFTADCLSIFLYDPKVPAIGLVHAGWRNTKENITARTVQSMEGKFNTKPKDLYASFGPAIRGCCYEVGREFKQFFLPDLIERGRHYYLDLVKINKKQVLDSGVREINIFDSKICTSCQNEGFFSYRKEGNSCGRMMSVMMLR